MFVDRACRPSPSSGRASPCSSRCSSGSRRGSSGRSTPAASPPRSIPQRGAARAVGGARPARRCSAAPAGWPPSEDPDALARDVLETTIAGLAAGTPLTFVPCDASGLCRRRRGRPLVESRAHEGQSSRSPLAAAILSLLVSAACGGSAHAGRRGAGRAAGAGQRRRGGREGHGRAPSSRRSSCRATSRRAPVSASSRACPGAIERVLVDIGQAVREGQPVATIDRREIDAQADAMAASVNVAKAGRRERRGRRSPTPCSSSTAPASCSRRAPCRASGSTPPRRRTRRPLAQRELARASLAQADAALRRAREVQRDATLVSPVAGHVVERNYDPGAIPGDEPVVVVADLRVLKLEAGVSELEAGRLRVGMPAEVIVQARPGEKLPRRAGRDRPRGQRAQPALPHRDSRAQRRRRAALGHVRHRAHRDRVVGRRRHRAARGGDDPRRQAGGARRCRATREGGDGHRRPDRRPAGADSSPAWRPATWSSPTRGGS